MFIHDVLYSYVAKLIAATREAVSYTHLSGAIYKIKQWLSFCMQISSRYKLHNCYESEAELELEEYE